jgi:D-alanyl-D-alanine carboxypeptidase/D-alanyl-D-alanine-endopeptidase (penicillin-binding protein 4)
MVPASTTKLLTVLTALQTLGNDFTFRTQVLRAGDDVYVKFSGDPSLTSQDIKNLLAQALNNRPIKGNLYIDASAFAAPWVARGWSVEDLPWYFAAPVSAVILNENSFTLNLIPAKQLDERLVIQSSDPALRVTSHVNAVDPETADTLCQLNVILPAPDQVTLEGCWPLDNQPVTLKIANVFPVETAQALIKSSLRFSGKINTGITPQSAQLLTEHRSAPLSALIKPILQDSNNLYADALTKTLGQQAYQRPTFQAGSYFIKTKLENELDIPPHEITLFDGSGLSTLNLISANALAKVLQKAYNDQPIRNTFIDALTTSGVNGSLKNRLTQLTPRFMGKTGGMSHVSTVAGYHNLDGDNPLIYVVMLNHGSASLGTLRQEVDKTLETFINSYFTNTLAADKL